jgi:formate hydrogenlyase subunit 6/NADH:ubiquinone oxidoreductase subunit I
MVKKIHLPTMAKRAAEQIFSKPNTTKYPFQKPQLSKDFRGQPIFDFDACIGCGLCSRDCPAKAIEMVTVEGKKRPQLNLSECIFCYQCAETCPKKAITSSTNYELATIDKSNLIKKPEASKKT